MFSKTYTNKKLLNFARPLEAQALDSVFYTANGISCSKHERERKRRNLRRSRKSLPIRSVLCCGGIVLARSPFCADLCCRSVHSCHYSHLALVFPMTCSAINSKKGSRETGCRLRDGIALPAP